MVRTSEQADKHTRDIARSLGRPCELPASFYAFMAPMPEHVSPRDYTTARAVVRMLKDARAKCRGDYSLTRSEHARLSALIKKWEHRASGKDARFNVMGVKPGRPTTYEQSRLEREGWESKHVSKNPMVYNRQCPVCRESFTASRKDKITCSPRCKSTKYEHDKRRQTKA